MNGYPATVAPGNGHGQYYQQQDHHHHHADDDDSISITSSNHYMNSGNNNNDSSNHQRRRRKGAKQHVLDYFCIEERGSTIGREIRAGVVTFLTMSYILLVNPQILSQVGYKPDQVWLLLPPSFPPSLRAS